MMTGERTVLKELCLAEIKNSDKQIAAYIADRDPNKGWGYEEQIKYWEGRKEAYGEVVNFLNAREEEAKASGL
jgi:hypothetical protein